MIEQKLIRLATVIGAAIFLCRTVFSRPERRKLNLAMRALDNVERAPRETGGLAGRPRG